MNGNLFRTARSNVVMLRSLRFTMVMHVIVGIQLISWPLYSPQVGVRPIVSAGLTRHVVGVTLWMFM